MTCTHGHYHAKVCALVKPLESREENRAGPEKHNAKEWQRNLWNRELVNSAVSVKTRVETKI